MGRLACRGDIEPEIVQILAMFEAKQEPKATTLVAGPMNGLSGIQPLRICSCIAVSRASSGCRGIRFTTSPR